MLSLGRLQINFEAPESIQGIITSPKFPMGYYWNHMWSLGSHFSNFFFSVVQIRLDHLRMHFNDLDSGQFNIPSHGFPLGVYWGHLFSISSRFSLDIWSVVQLRLDHLHICFEDPDRGQVSIPIWKTPKHKFMTEFREPGMTYFKTHLYIYFYNIQSPTK